MCPLSLILAHTFHNPSFNTKKKVQLERRHSFHIAKCFMLLSLDGATVLCICHFIKVVVEKT